MTHGASPLSFLYDRAEIPPRKRISFAEYIYHDSLLARRQGWSRIPDGIARGSLSAGPRHATLQRLRLLLSALLSDFTLPHLLEPPSCISPADTRPATPPSCSSPAGCRYATVVSRISSVRSARHYSATFPSCISFSTSRIVTALADVAPVRSTIISLRLRLMPGMLYNMPVLLMAVRAKLILGLQSSARDVIERIKKLKATDDILRTFDLIERDLQSRSCSPERGQVG